MAPCFNPKVPLRVLVLEDDEADRALMQQGLLTSVVQLEFCCTLAELEDKYDAERYDAVIVDLGIPDSDGPIDTAIRARMACQDSPIVAITGMGDEQMTFGRKVLFAGVQGYLIKGQYTPDGLIRMLEDAVEAWTTPMTKRPNKGDDAKRQAHGTLEPETVGEIAKFAWRNRGKVAAVIMSIATAIASVSRYWISEIEARHELELKACEERKR